MDNINMILQVKGMPRKDREEEEKKDNIVFSLDFLVEFIA